MSDDDRYSDRQREAFDAFDRQQEERRRREQERTSAASRDAEPPDGAPPAGWYPHRTLPSQEVYWDGNAWTDTRAVPPSAGVQSVGGFTRRVDPTYAWTMALIPLAGLALNYLAPAADYELVLVGFLVVNFVLMVLDGRKIRHDAGIEPMTPFAAFLVPVYLIWRTRRLHSTPAIPVAWFATFALSVVGGLTFAATYVFDSEDVESEIAAWFSETQGMLGVTVDCPSIAGREGDTFDCTASRGGDAGNVVVTLTSDGSYMWEVG